MKLFNLFICLFLAAYFFSPQNIIAAELVIAADSWCPINCEPNSLNQGFMVEIAKTVFAKEGHTVKYIQLPWKRAIVMAREGKVDAIIGAFHGDAPDFIFPQNEQAVLTNSFYALKDSTLNIKNTSSLQKVTLGIINGYDYGNKLKKYIEKAPKDRIVAISGDRNLVKRLMALLELNRVDVIVEADLVFRYEMHEMKKTKLFKNIGVAAKPMKAYIAFSPNGAKSLEYSKILSEGMDKIKRSGELDQIMGKYVGTFHKAK